MAAFDDLPMRLDAGGAIIQLTRKPDRDWAERLPDGIEVQVTSGSSGIRVEGLDLGSGLDDLPALARDIANQALDLMAVRSVGTYALADQAAPYICWTGRRRTTIRVAREAHHTFALSLGGPPSPPPPVDTRACATSGCPRTTTDLFDAFRNLYLALESILSHIAPIRLRPGRAVCRGRGRMDPARTGRGSRLLQARDSTLTFGRYLSAPIMGDGIDLVFADLFQATRTAIFHAKNGRVFALPQNQRDRQQIADALARYALLYTDLAEHVLGVRFLRSGLATAGQAHFRSHRSLIDQRPQVSTMSVSFRGLSGPMPRTCHG